MFKAKENGYRVTNNIHTSSHTIHTSRLAGFFGVPSPGTRKTEQWSSVVMVTTIEVSSTRVLLLTCKLATTTKDIQLD